MNAGSVAAHDRGEVTAIYIASMRNVAMKSVASVEAVAGKGLVNDRYHGSKHRHVSVQSVEDLSEAEREFDAPIGEHLTRRNITVSGVALPNRPGELMNIGNVELEVVRIAAPCKLLDDDIGAGAKTALRRRAGTIFRLLSSGTIDIGDPVTVLRRRPIDE